MSALPSHGWKGYGRPGHPYDAGRQKAIQRDLDGHDLREWAFSKWLRETVYGAAVNRWIDEIGRWQ